MLNGLGLFDGIGGLSIALRDWVLPKAYCEIDRYAQCVLLSRMSEGELFQAPIWDDVRTLKGELLPPIDMVYAGFPCQDISVAGHGAGLDGERSGLFFEIIRLVGELGPKFVFLENVPAITTRGGLRVITEFARLGYDCRWTIVSAAELGAVHIRKRWFLLAYADGERLRQESGEKDEIQSTPQREMVAYRSRFPRRAPGTPEGFASPRVGRAGDGLPCRRDRHKALGNAVVPIQAREAFMRLSGLNNCKVNLHTSEGK